MPAAPGRADRVSGSQRLGRRSCSRRRPVLRSAASQASRRWSSLLRRAASPTVMKQITGTTMSSRRTDRLVAPAGVGDESRHEKEGRGAGEPDVADQRERERHAEQDKRPGRERMPRAERVEPADSVPELAREEQRQHPDAAQADTVGDDSLRSGLCGLGGAHLHPRPDESRRVRAETVYEKSRSRRARCRAFPRGWRAHGRRKRMQRDPSDAFAFHCDTTLAVARSRRVTVRPALLSRSASASSSLRPDCVSV